MQFFIYFLIFSSVPILITGFSQYGIIRNASIKLPFGVNNDTGYEIKKANCNQCLCHAVRDPTVVLFTCTQDQPMQVVCQTYYFMPKRDEIEYPKNDTDIYLIQANKTFEKKDDCCNTTKLIEKIKEQLQLPTINRTIYPSNVRSLAEGDNETILTVVAHDERPKKKLLKFDKVKFLNLPVPDITSSLMSVGYHKDRYYFGTDDSNIGIYDSTMSRNYGPIPSIHDDVPNIRFLKQTDQMLAAASSSGIYLCEKDGDGLLKNCSQIPNIAPAKKLHAIGVVPNETAFYVGSKDADQNIHLYRLQENGTWTTNDNDKINHTLPVSDLVVDDCQRIWAVEPRSDRIRIYDQDKTFLAEIELNTTNLNNLMIVENYRMFMTHDSLYGLQTISPSLNCRPVR